ncbi:MAG: hypothetical protein NW203_12935 [Hyphomonadaceae bacterium]|nr:hypothetical protein [Hyphomonadaceae bacterium]
MRALAVLFALTLWACAPAQPDADDAAAPAPRALPDDPRELLIECGGALVAQHGLDPAAAAPTLGTPAETAYWTVLALMDKEPGLEGAAGKAAAAARAATWATRPAGDRAERAALCLARFQG